MSFIEWIFKSEFRLVRKADTMEFRIRKTKEWREDDVNYKRLGMIIKAKMLLEERPFLGVGYSNRSFAAYNAGPARVRGLRRDAKKMGLDPNRWFRNVELAAAKRIGRETVDYVRNIYKYYVAYTLVVERQKRREAAREAVAK